LKTVKFFFAKVLSAGSDPESERRHGETPSETLVGLQGGEKGKRKKRGPE